MELIIAAKAGRLNLVGGKTLVPDPRRGLLRVVQSDEGLLHVEWLVRDASESSGQTEPEMTSVIFPEECRLEQIGSSRNYVLKFSADKDRNCFFWLQDPDAGTDRAFVEDFNRAVNGEPIATSVPAKAAPSTASHSAVAGLPPPTVDAAGQLAASLLARMAATSRTTSGAAAGARPREGAVAPAATSSAEAQRRALMAALAGLQHQQQPDQGPSLGEVLRPEILAPLLRDPGSLERLSEHLPPEHRTPSGLSETLSSQSFRQQVSSLGAALQSGQISLAQFGLEPKGFSVADFLEAIQESVDKEKGKAKDAPQGGGPAADNDAMQE